MPLKYASGEEIQPGDRVRYHGEPGQVDFVAKPDDPKTSYYIQQFGSGCMITAQGFGAVFVIHPGQDEDLKFVSRGVPSSGA